MAKLAELVDKGIDPGDYLVNAYQRRFAAAFAMDLLEREMKASSVADAVRLAAEEYDGDGDGNYELSSGQLAGIGDQAMQALVRHDMAEQAYAAVREGRKSVDEDLLELCDDLIGKPMGVRAVGSGNGIRWDKQPHKVDSRQEWPYSVNGVITHKPEMFVPDGILELSPVGFRSVIPGGIYVIDPVRGNGTAAVSIDVNLED